MSQYYTPKRVKNIYDPSSKEPFKLSRSRIELFMECPRCFYLDRRLGTDRPKGYPFNLNTAVDTLLKKEFDLLRKSGRAHAIMRQYNINARPARNNNLDTWRQNFKGVEYLHKPTNLLIHGAVDDIWETPEGEYIVVDYKSTSKTGEIVALNQGWQDSYKRQMEIYQWLLRKNGYNVSDTGYFLYCNGRTDLDKFDGKMEFDITLIAYKGNDKWVEPVINDIHECLNRKEPPVKAPDCAYCAYREAAKEALKDYE